MGYKKCLVVCLLGAGSLVSHAAQQCFTTAGTYGAVNITESPGCASSSSRYNPFTMNGRLGFVFTASTTCTISFNKPIVTSTVSIDVDGNNIGDGTPGDITTLSTNSGPYTVIPADITAPLSPAYPPGSITASSSGTIIGDGSGTFRFTNSPPATIEELSIALFAGESGTFYRVCADDGATAAPAVTAIAPSTGSTAGGTAVTVTGADLTGATAVTVGGVACTPVNVVSATSVTCTTGAHAAGAASVEVTTPGGTNIANTLFIYSAASPSSIPTLSEWGMILMSALLGLFGLAQVRRRR